MKTSLERLLKPPAALLLALAVFLLSGVAGAQGPEEEGKKEIREQRIVVEKDLQGGPRGAFLGVVPRALDHVLRAALDYEEAGVLLAEVVPDGPAHKAGLQVGDILVKLNNRPVHDVDRLFALMKGLKAGETVELVLWRKDKQRTVKVVLEDRPRPQLGWLDSEHGALQLDLSAEGVRDLQGLELELQGLSRELEDLTKELDVDAQTGQIRLFTNDVVESEIN
ncbi:MAG: PDZ domain-containing protein [Candidatus Delongbacteria bacterium]